MKTPADYDVPNGLLKQPALPKPTPFPRSQDALREQMQANGSEEKNKKKPNKRHELFDRPRDCTYDALLLLNAGLAPQKLQDGPKKIRSRQ